MRIHVVLLVIALSPCLRAQDPGMMAAQQAAQQAAQAAQQANQEAMRQAQQANEDAARASQQASQNAQQMARICPPAARPQFSVKAGSFTKPVTVKIREKTRGAVVYYTTDGWTPTTNSTRYTGPITITSTTTLQAIAVAPDMPRSRIASGFYTVNGPVAQSGPVPGTPVASAPPVETSPAIRMLPKGTSVHLVFASNFSSRKADVGDKINLSLAEDLKIGDVVVAPKGTTAIVNVTEAHKSGVAGIPGFVSFEAESLAIDGTVIKLQGSAAKEGREVQINPATVGLAFVVPGGVFLVHGNEAEIKQASVFTAMIAEDTKLTK
jgi:Chitobiase/beta-hexosaminidase C-terminal domain